MAPKFISNSPCGEDKFNGQSQERLANAIAEHFKTTDSLQANKLSRIIGLEGEWGSGKSNVIKLVKNKLPNYHFFEYDVWGHQEDLQRRSILETLTRDLIKHGFLKGVSPSLILKNTNVTWEDKLNELLARRIVTDKNVLPKLNPAALWTALALACTPISTFFAERLNDRFPDDFTIGGLIIIAFLPIILAIIIWRLLAAFHPEMNGLDYFLKISQREDSHTKTYESISEDEPTVAKFAAWFLDISNSLNSSKIVVVFDNMDRLPADKVKELWSSFHTFFAEGDYQNIWVIIPYDEEHLACAFDGDDTEENKKLVKLFINKTFPITFRVPPPILTDFKDLFYKLYHEAFGHFNDSSSIYRVFKILSPKTNPRQIISFINQLVTLKRVWQDEINPMIMSVFILKQDEILKNPIDQILSGEYLAKVNKIVPNNMGTQDEISALVYGIDISLAKQVALTKYIEMCFTKDSNYDINKYCQHEKFNEIIEEVILNTDTALINDVLETLNILDEKENHISLDTWNGLAEVKISDSLLQQKIENAHKIILTKCDDSYKQLLVDHIVKSISNFPTFKGNDYYSSLNELEEFIKVNNISVRLNIVEIEKPPTDFIDYVLISKEYYKKYKLSTNPNQLDQYYANSLPGKLNNTSVLEYLAKDNTYTFEVFLKTIEDKIDKDEINEANFYPIFYAYKCISKSKPLVKQLNPSKLSTILSNFNKSASNGIFPDGYFDLVAMSLCKGIDVDLLDSHIQQVADCIQYYDTIGRLLILNLSSNLLTLRKVLVYLVENRLGEVADVNMLLQQFKVIISNLGISAETLIGQLNRWHENLNTTNNIEVMIPNVEFISHSISIENELTLKINSIAAESLSKVSNDLIYKDGVLIVDGYWYKLLTSMINSKFLRPLPQNLSLLGKVFIKDVCASRFSLPLNDILQTLITNLDRRTTGSTIIEIRDSFCNGNAKITPEIFKFIHPWFTSQGELRKRPDEVITYILKPVIENTECLRIIITDSDFYTEIINLAETTNNEIKEWFQRRLETDDNEQLINFCEKVGIVKNAIADENDQIAIEVDH